MLDAATIPKIKRLRRLGYTWREVATKTGLPATTLYYATRRRQTVLQRYKIQQRRDKMRRLQAKIKYLEAKVEALRGIRKHQHDSHAADESFGVRGV